MDRHLLPTAAAAARVGIKAATLYAYVSRGLLTAHRLPGQRGSWFDPVQLDALVRRARGPAERRPDLLVNSAITLIEGGRYWYRGEAPEVLAARHSYEAVAEFLWNGQLPPAAPAWPSDAEAVARARRAATALSPVAGIIDRLRVVVAIAGANDSLRFDLRPSGAIATARRLVGTTVAALAARPGGSVARQVGSWVTRRRLSYAAIRAVDTALTIMADHELAASTLAVRVAASFKADPYAAVSAGLGALAGTWHGAASGRVETALQSIARGQSPEQVIGRLLHEDHVVPGFGHLLYPDGDPRVGLLLPLAQSFRPVPEAAALLAVAAAQGLPLPNVDFALAVFARALGLSNGGGEAIFAVGRLAGWIAHALEEYAERTPFRHRALYVGSRPGAPHDIPA